MILVLKEIIKKKRFIHKLYIFLKLFISNLKSFIFRNYFYYLHKKKIKQLKSKEIIEVAFLISRISQWKCQSLYLQFKDNDRFQVTIYIVPDNDDVNNSEFYNELSMTYKILKKNGLNVVNGFNKNEDLNKVQNRIYKSDIIFFTRITKWDSKFGLQNFKNSLTCYVPYSIHVDKNDYLQLGQLFHQCLWSHYLPIKHFVELAKKIYPAKNCKLIGYPGFDPFIDQRCLIIDKSIKTWSNKKKKIIWAPHHSIEEGSHWPFFSTFLIYSKKMVNLLEKSYEELEICFKPHPGLKEKLYQHANWGKDKTEQYYNYWKNAKNGILHESIYHDNFLNADAMLLDSVSFITEFAFIEKPICFLTRNDKGDYRNFMNNAGLIVFDSIQKASSWEEAENFIDQIQNYENSVYNLKQKESFIKLGINKNQKSSDKVIANIISSIS